MMYYSAPLEKEGEMTLKAIQRSSESPPLFLQARWSLTGAFWVGPPGRAMEVTLPSLWSWKVVQQAKDDYFQALKCKEICSACVTQWFSVYL